MYSRHLNGPLLAAYEKAEVGTLSYDIKVAKAKLDWALEKWRADPDGGPVTSQSESTSEAGSSSSTTRKLWSDIVESHHKTVKDLERAHHEITSENPVPGNVQVNIQLVAAFSGMDEEALKQYAEKGTLDAKAWLKEGG
jgi:hypothetical protein